MTAEEYKQKLEELDKEFKIKKKEIDRLFASSNVKFKVGDIIKDSTEIILIDKITWGYTFNGPSPCYSGFCLKKDLTPRKDKSRANLYTDLEKVN